MFKISLLYKLNIMRTSTNLLWGGKIKEEYFNQWLQNLSDDFQMRADNYFKAKQELLEEAGWTNGLVWTHYEKMKYELQHATNNYFNVLAFIKKCGNALD